MKNKLVCIACFIMICTVFTGCSAKSTKIIGYIKNIDQEEMTIELDEIAWITPDDEDMIAELKIDEKYGFPNGYYRHNESKDTTVYTVSKDATFVGLNFETEYKPNDFSFEEFTANHNSQYDKYFKDTVAKDETFDFFTPYWVVLQDGVVIDIQEQFIP